MKLVVCWPVLVAATFTIGCTEGPKKTVTDEPLPAHLVEFERTWLKDFVERNHKRINGVLLDASAEVKGDEILIRWTIDYNGPRPPLTILEPYYPDERQQTRVQLIIPEGNKVQAVTVWPPGRWISEPLPEKLGPKEYATLKHQTVAKGTVKVPLKHAKESIFKKLTLDRANELTRDLYVELVHAPYVRGFDFDFDSWTVEKNSDEALHAVPRRVVIRDWP